MPDGTDAGPAALLIREHRPKDPKIHDTWGPPGGKTDATDHSPLHAALREFKEEVGVPIDLLKLANLAGRFYYVRLRPTPDANEAWMLFIDSDAEIVENALFGQDRSGWNLWKRMNTKLSNEVSGYAFVSLDALLKMDRSGNILIGNHQRKLRIPRYTIFAAKTIQNELAGLAAPAPAAAGSSSTTSSASGTPFEQHGIHLRITPAPAAMNSDVQKAIDSQMDAWGGLHVTITGFALRQSLATLKQTNPAAKDCKVHGSGLADFVKTGTAILTQHGGPWRPTDFSMKGKMIGIKSDYLDQLEKAATGANLAKVKSAAEAHVSIGDAKYAPSVLAALKHKDTRWELGIAVTKWPHCSKGAQVQFVRVKDSVQIWP
jgi:8-oxo-dGTP pyrophosphatase MutT (NUDIX family)